MVLNEREQDKVLIAACPGLNWISLRDRRPIYRFQLHIVIANDWSVVYELFPTRWAISRSPSNRHSLVDAGAPDVHLEAPARHRISVKIEHFARYGHPITAGVVGEILQVLRAPRLALEWEG